MDTKENFENIKSLKKDILENYPRLNKDSKFKFTCHQSLECYTACCADINIFLTPYDVIRLKNRLGLTSGKFLSKYTITPFTKTIELPVVVLKMTDKEGKPCNFVSEKGCSGYEDRPWSCRMYPVGLASKAAELDQKGFEFYFLMQDENCLGLKEKKEFTIQEWLENQEIEIFDQMSEHFKEITLHKFFDQGNKLSPEQMEMFFMVAYDIDRFKSFIFDSSFFERFEVEPELIEKMRNDDVELMKFGFRWLKLCLFGERTLKVKNDKPRSKR